MGGSLTGPNRIKDVYKKIVFYDDNKFKVDNGSSDVVITSADNFSGDTQQTLINKTIDADNNTISNLEVDNLKSGVLDTDLSSVAITDTTIASAKAIKTYVDSQDAVKANTTYVDSQDATKLTKSDNLSDLASASTARTNLGVDAAGTDNSTDVTLAGSLGYITLSGQEITRNAINLGTDVTSQLPISNGGTGASDANTARTNLGVDAAGTDNSTDVTLAGKDYITASGTNNQTLTLGTIDISDDTNLIASTGITLTDDTLTTNDSEIDHNNLNNYDSDEHVAHTNITLTAGAGLTADSGGNIAASRSFDIGAGTGITVNTNDVAVDTSVIATKTYVDTQVNTVNTLEELTDTNITSPSDKALLQYDNNTNKWIGVTEIDGGQFV